MNAIYDRKSRTDDPSASVEEVLASHARALEALAERNGIAVDDVYREVVSGESLAARPEMLKLLQGIRAGVYDAVLCMDIDRLGRGGMADQGVILDAFRDSGTLIVTPDKTYDLSNDADEELTEFKAFFARREYKMIRKRMLRGKMDTIKSGGYIANAPYGYRKCVIDKLPSLEIVEEEAEFVRYIFSRYTSGAGSEVIAQELNALGSSPRRSDQWNRSTIRRLLRNPVYTGKIAWNRRRGFKAGSHGKDRPHTVTMPEEEWIMADGKHKAIISEETFDRAQEVCSKRYVPSTKTGHTMNPFAGLIICSRCGMKMQLTIRPKAKGGPYILCTVKGCQAGAKMEYVEEAVIAALHDELEHIWLRSIGIFPQEELDRQNQLLRSLQKEGEKLEARKTKLYELLEDGVYDKPTFQSRMKSAENELSALSARLADAERIKAGIETSDMHKTADQLETVLKLYPTLDAEQKNMLLKTVVDHITYTKPKKTKPRDFSLEITLKHIV